MTSSADRTLNLFESVTSVNPQSIPPAPAEYNAFRSWMQSDDFKKMSYEARHAKAKAFYEQPFIQEYLDKKWSAQLHNQTAILWLAEYRNKHLKADDQNESHAISVKIEQFLNFIGNQFNVFPALRLDLRKLGL